MRHILLTGNDPEHRYVANTLARRVGLRAVIVDLGKKVSFNQKLRTTYRRYAAKELVERILLYTASKVLGSARKRNVRLEQTLGAASRSFDASLTIYFVNGVNQQEALLTVRELVPKRILVYGTGIVSKKMLSLSQLPPLNMHTGISPYYRGTHCYFWPVFNRELSMLGATIHECVRDIDGGRIYGVAQAELEVDDDIYCVLARCVLAGTDLFVRVVSDLEHDVTYTGIEQDLTLGKEYRANMRGICAEFRVHQLLKGAAIRDHLSGKRPVAFSNTSCHDDS